MISRPLLLLLLPLIMTPIAYLVRRFPGFTATLASGTAVFLAIVTLSSTQTPVTNTLVVFGRQLVLQPADRLILAFIYLVAAGLWILAGRVDQGRVFFPLNLSLLSVFAGVLLVQPYVYGILLLPMAAALSVMLIQGRRPESTQAALRYLVFTTLAAPPVLVTGWLLELYHINPDETQLLQTSILLLAIGFAILLAVVPFHAWVPAIGAEAPPLVTALIFSIGQVVVLGLILNLMQEYSWLAGNQQLYNLMRIAGIAMVVLGGILSFSRQSFGRLLGYAVLIDMGAVLLALGLANEAGLQAALTTLLMRPISLGLVGIGLSLIRQKTGGSDSFAAVRGLGWRLPFATMALVSGSLSLAGFPLTPGFVARWALLRLLAIDHPVATTALFLAGVAVAITNVRGLSSLLAPVPAASTEASPLAGDPASTEEASAPFQPAPQERESWQSILLLSGCVFAGLVIAVFPQIILPAVNQAVALFTFWGG